MKLHRARKAVLASLVLLANAAAAQEPLRPAQRQELWVSAAVTSRLPESLHGLLGRRYDRFRVRGELGYRSADVFFAGRQIYLDVNLRFKPKKWLALAFEHRFAGRNGTPGLRNRSIVQAEMQKEFGRAIAEYRFIYQHSFIEWGGQREVFRNRFQLGYNIPKWKFDPELSVEFFTWAGNKGWSYFGTRWQFGTQYKLSKGHSISASLINDRERDKAWPTHRWIGSFTYTVNLRDL